MKKPNFILVVSDDLGYADTGFLAGNTVTPNLDTLAHQGTIFQKFYGNDYCTPCRAALMTGLYPWRLGMQSVIKPWGRNGLPDDVRTLPQALTEIGYECHLVGKWHLGHYKKSFLPTNRGFISHYGSYTGYTDYYTHKNRNGLDWVRNGRPIHEKGYTTRLLTNEAKKVIQQAKDPYFLYLPYTAPHGPFQPSPDSDLPLGRYTKDRIILFKKVYYSMVKYLDRCIGEVLDLATKKNKNTYVFFTADNGSPHRFCVGKLFSGVKGTLLEGGLRVPAFVHGPDVKEQTLVERFYAADYHSTILELAGAKSNDKLDGNSLVEHLAGQATVGREEIVHNINSPNENGLTFRDHKLIKKPKKTLLFNTALDPLEKNNVAEDNKKLVKMLEKRLDHLTKHSIPWVTYNEPKKQPKAWGITMPPADQ